MRFTMNDQAGLRPPELIDVTIERDPPDIRYHSRIEVHGARIVADDGREFTGQLLVGFNSVASVMERQLRDQHGPLRGVVEQMEDHLLVEAVWDGEKLIDGDGADISGMDHEEDD